MSPHIVILGAGISGLATAWFLKQALGSQIRLTVLEKEQRAGGWIQTLHTQGFLFEQGPRSCRSKGAGQETLALIEALGLQEEVLIPHADAQQRYLYDGQRLQRFPKHLWEIPFHSLTRGWLKAVWHDWSMPKRQGEDESIQSFFARRLGQPWVDRLIDPFVLGIYAGECERLSLKSCFPLFDQWEQQQGSLLRGAWFHRPPAFPQTPFIQSIRRFPLFSFKQGMETLPRTLANELKQEVLFNREVHDLHVEKSKINVQLKTGQQLQADYVISTLPASVLSTLLPTYSGVAATLKELRYATVWVVNIGFSSRVLPLKGFGYLVPSQAGLWILGCVWDSSIFPQQNLNDQQTRLTVMLGGRYACAMEHLSEQEIQEYALQMLQQQLGIRASPQSVQIKRAYAAIPQYEVGYHAWKKEMQEKMHEIASRLILSGSAWTGVSINDCIAHARQCAEHLVQKIKN